MTQINLDNLRRKNLEVAIATVQAEVDEANKELESSQPKENKSKESK